MAVMAQTSGYRERNSTADRALNVLQMFSDDRPEISAVEVAENLGVARSTAYRYLQTLVQSQFLDETGRGSFRLGMRILELARIARQGYGLSELCIPAMRELAGRFHQTVLLTKRMGNVVVCLEREESREQYVRLSYERGTVLSLNAGASALILEAWLPEDQVRELLGSVSLRKFTRNTLTDADAIIGRLAQIRKDGYAITAGEVDPAALGIAAPIFRQDGEVLAGISAVLIQSLVPPALVDEIVEAVIATARALTDKASVLQL
jgi:DNA-binding IclR family transcriptional regulator